MTIPIDDYTITINQILDKHFKSIALEILEVASPDIHPENSSDLDALNKKYTDIQTLIVKICQKYPRHQFLIAVRKIPFDFIQAFHKHMLDLDKYQSHGIFNVSIGIATNNILIHSPNVVKRALPDDVVITDALRLLLLCNIRRIIQMKFMTYRYSLKTSQFEFDNLSVFDEMRQIRPDINNQCDRTDKAAIVNLLSLNILTFGKQVVIFHAPSKRVAETKLVNYLPIFFNGNKISEDFGWLDDLDFESKNAISFDKFWKCYVILNKYITDRIVNWSPDETFIYENEADLAQLRFLLRLSESGLIELKKDDLMLNFARRSKLYPEITVKDFELFIDLVTINEKAVRSLNSDFTDKRFIFYPGSSDTLLWDVSQQCVLFRTIAREMVEGGDRGGNVKGRAYQDYVEQKLLACVPDIEMLRKNVIIYSDKNIKLMDIDIGLVFRGALFLIEVKSRQKNIGKYLGYHEKIDRPINELKRYD